MAAICAVRLKPPVDETCPVVLSPKDKSVSFKPSKDHRLARLPAIAPIRFDHCFDHSATQHNVFASLSAHYIDHVLDGHNACVMSYGSRKSIMGDDEEPGLALLSCEELFCKLPATTTVAVSFVEIYNETVMDLLDSRKRQRRVREHPVFGPYVSDLSWYTLFLKLVTSSSIPVSDYFTLIQIFYTGLSRRIISSTPMNPLSSRSHVLFSLQLTHAATSSHPSSTSSLQFIDLAGCERSSVHLPSSTTFKEGTKINQSLSSLSLVLSALLQKAKHPNASVFVPYRDSILTWLLKESLEPTCHGHDLVRYGEEGKKSVIVMVANVKGDEAVLDETVASVRYVARVKGIEKVLRKKWQDEPRESTRRVDVVNGSDTGESEHTKLLLKSNENETEKLRRHLDASKTLIKDMEALWRQKLLFMEEKYEEEKRRREIVEEKLALFQNSGNNHTSEDAVEIANNETAYESVLVNNEEKEMFRYQTDETTQENHENFDSFLISCDLNIDLPLCKGNNYIGSDPDKATIVLDGCFIAALHATISIQDETWISPNYLNSIGEHSKVYVNGFLISGPTQLKSGVRILFGRSHMFQYVQRATLSQETVASFAPSTSGIAYSEAASSEVVQDTCPVFISIPHVDRIRSNPRPYDLFHILITIRTPSSLVSWTVARRYSEFYHFFHSSMIPDSIRSQFPRKLFHIPFSKTLLERRRHELEQFLAAVLKWFWSTQGPEFTWSEVPKPIFEKDVWNAFPVLSPKGSRDEYTGKWIQLK